MASPPTVNRSSPLQAVRPLFGAVIRPIQAFLRLEAASGILLFIAAVGALVWANLVSPSGYRAVFDYPLTIGAGESLLRFSLLEIVNDGLMAVFFFVVGMEIKRELVVGELRTVGRALLPGIAALGGMAVPALIFLALNWGKPGQPGWGIPMATDIAFTIGCLALLRNRVPNALIVFVTALAIFDDIGGILVIALFYGHGLRAGWLLVAGAITAALFLMNRLYVRSGIAYAGAGLGLWYALHHGGIHATIAGVILGLMIPARPRRAPHDVLSELTEYATGLQKKPRDEELEAAEILMIEGKLEDLEPPLDRFVHLLHPYVAFAIMPLFALANSGVSLTGMGIQELGGPVALGAAAGLFAGKQLGIFAATMVAVRLGVAPIPGNASIAKLYGVSVVAGIGFTVALFIAALAYPGSKPLLDQAKIGILLGSLAAGLIGSAVLALTPRLAERP